MACLLAEISTRIHNLRVCKTTVLKAVEAVALIIEPLYYPYIIVVSNFL